METPKAFTSFPLLPTEIRLMIWRFSLPTCRRISQFPNHDAKADKIPHLIACKESQAVVLSHFTRAKYQTKPRSFLVDFETDWLDFRLPYKLIPCDFSDTRKGKKYYMECGLYRIRTMISIFFFHHLVRDPDVEAVMMVLPRVGDKTITSAQREDFLRYLKLEFAPTLWMDKNFLEKSKNKCAFRYGKEREWRMPKVLFDVEALVVDRIGEERREVDMALVEGKPDEKLVKEWNYVMYKRSD